MDTVTGHVLVVDDDPLVLMLCRRTLQHAGFQVDQAPSGETLLETVKQYHFDLVLLDMHMPGLDGLTLLEQIRSYNLDVPIVIITGTASIEHAARAIRAGAQGFLLKPFSNQDLVDTILDVLQKRRDFRVHDRIAALRPVVQISQQLLAEVDLPGLYTLIIDTVRSELSVDRASLMIYEREGLQIVACSGLPAEVQPGQYVNIDKSIAGWVARHRRPLLVSSGNADDPVLADIQTLVHEDEQIVSALSVPLMAGNNVLGVLNAAKLRHHAGRPFSDADRELLLLLAGQAAIAIENARLYANVAQSEARYRALLYHANDAVLLLDAQATSIIDANPALQTLSGYSREELLTLPPVHLLPQLEHMAHNRNGASDRGDPAADLINLPTLGTPMSSRHTGNEVETNLRTRTGAMLPIAVSISQVLHEGQSLLLLMAREISERQRIAHQLMQTEKLAAVGRLSASLAHEMNNPLQALHNSLNLLLTRSELPESKRGMYLSMARDEVERMISIVSRMIDFYRPSRDGMRPTGLHDLLDTVLQMTREQLSSRDIELVLELHPELPLVFAVGNHIKQVFLNIIFNAIEAMATGGTLTIRSYVLAASDDLPEAGYSLVPGSGAAGFRVREPSIVIEFGDTGPGIPPADLPKIFEPFYTTHDKGTGLGLAVSYSIIEQHNGELSVSSRPGRGATFRIRLPVAQ